MMRSWGRHLHACPWSGDIGKRENNNQKSPLKIDLIVGCMNSTKVFVSFIGNNLYIFVLFFELHSNVFTVPLKMSEAKVLPGHYVGHRNSRWGPLQGALTQLRQGRKLGPVLATSLLFWSLSDLGILAQNRIQKGQLEANIIVTTRNVVQLLIQPACVGGTGRLKVGPPRSPFDWKYRKRKVAQTPNFTSGNPRECMFYLINSNVCFQF